MQDYIGTFITTGDNTGTGLRFPFSVYGFELKHIWGSMNMRTFRVWITYTWDKFFWDDTNPFPET